MFGYDVDLSGGTVDSPDSRENIKKYINQCCMKPKHIVFFHIFLLVFVFKNCVGWF